MKEVLQELLEQGNAQVHIQVNGADLREFGVTIVKKTVEMLADEKKEVMLKVTEVTEKLRVSRSALYRWEESGYLRPVRIGGRVRYRLSDVEAVIKLRQS